MTVTFHSRTSVGLGSPVLSRLAQRTPAELSDDHMGVTWHHVGDGGTLFRPDQAQRLRAIWHYHVEVRGYGDIAYHGAFDADGNVYGLRDGRYVGAHALSIDNAANRLTDGVCFLEDRRGITAAAREAFAWWVNLERFLHAGRCANYAHEWWAKGRGGTPTECPGAGVIQLVAAQHGGA